MRMVSAFILLLFLATPVQAWTLREKTDNSTDEVRREICARDSSSNEICFSMPRGELWMSVELAGSSAQAFAVDRLPTLQVDKFNAHDSNDLLKHEKTLGSIIPRQAETRSLLFRAQVADGAGMDSLDANEKGLWYQLHHGEKLAMRVYLHRGDQADSRIELTGLKPHLGRLRAAQLSKR